MEPAPSVAFMRQMLESCEKRAGEARRTTSESVGLETLYLRCARQFSTLPEEGREKRPAMDLARGLSSAKWADDGSLWQAFVASVRHLAAAQQLDTRVLHGDGTNTVAKKGAMALAIRATNTRQARKSLPSSTIMAMC